MPRKKKPATNPASEIPEAITSLDYTLYNTDWVAEAAVKGWHRFRDLMKETAPMPMPDVAERPVSIIYYTAFEDALNTFLRQCLDDHLNEFELCLSELGKVTASLRKDLNKDLNK